MIETIQQSTISKTFRRASINQRLLAGGIFIALFLLFGFFRLIASGYIDATMLFGICGFQQKYGLPCPTCGMTTATTVFCQGKILQAFYIQPASALLCCCLAAIAFLALFTVCFGVYFKALEQFYSTVKLRYIIVTLVIIIAAGWVVTFIRELVENSKF